MAGHGAQQSLQCGGVRLLSHVFALLWNIAVCLFASVDVCGCVFASVGMCACVLSSAAFYAQQMEWKQFRDTVTQALHVTSQSKLRDVGEVCAHVLHFIHSTTLVTFNWCN